MTPSVDSIIRDSLLEREGVTLPGIGSLNVRMIHARIDGNRILPPRWTAEFSTNEDCALRDIRKLIAERMPLCADPDAEYSEWLRSAERKDGIAIKGVGRISNGSLVPDSSLTEAMTPLPEARLARKRKRHPGMWACVPLLAILVLLGIRCRRAGYVDRWMDFKHGTAASAAAPDSPAEPVTAPLEAEPEPEPAAQTSAAPAEKANDAQADVTRSDMYYLSVGVFSVEENAEKMIAEDPLKIGSGNYKTLSMGSRTMVYAFQSDSQEEIQRLYRKYSSQFPGKVAISKGR